MKKNKKVISIIWFLFTAIMLSFSSFAWLSTNRVLGFQSFNIHIASRGGIEVSVDAVDWKSVMTLTDLIQANRTYPTSTNQIPRLLRPVSTSGEVENGRLRMFSGRALYDYASSNMIIAAERSNEREGFGQNSSGAFIAFDLFFRNQTDMTLFLSPASTITPIGQSSGIENALRVAFLKQGTLPSTANLRDIQTMSGANSSIIWEPNYERHTESAIAHARDTYGLNISNNFNRIIYSGIRNEILSSERISLRGANAYNYPNKFRQVPIDIATRSNFNNLEEIMIINPGITKVRIYIWIEGQDIDCEDNASLGSLLINLQLSAEYL